MFASRIGLSDDRTNRNDEADNDTGSVLNRFVEGHTHESIDQQFKKLQSLSSMQEMD